MTKGKGVKLTIKAKNVTEIKRAIKILDRRASPVGWSEVGPELLEAVKKVCETLEIFGYGGRNPKTERRHIAFLHDLISRASGEK